MNIFIKLVISLLYASSCFAQGFYEKFDAFIPLGGNQCGRNYSSGERILNKGEGCRVILRATKDYKNVLRYKVLFRPLGFSSYAFKNGSYVDKRTVVSRTKIFKDENNQGYESIRFPMRGTGEYFVIIDRDNNGYFGEESYLGWLYSTPKRLKTTN